MTPQEIAGLGPALTRMISIRPSARGIIREGVRSRVPRSHPRRQWEGERSLAEGGKSVR